VVAGPILTVPNGYPIAVNHFPSLTVTSPDDAARKTAFLAGQGADLIKTALEPSGLPALSEEEMRAIVQAAHRSGLRVRVHQTNLTALNRAVEAGVDVVDHVEGYALPGLIQTMVEKDMTWVPTLKVIQVFSSADYSRTVQEFFKAGGRVAMGTDSGYYTFLGIGMPMDEMEFLAKAGLDPMQVIIAATRNSAYACGLEREVGTIETGKTADVLVLGDNPLRDLQALAQPRMVIHLGKVVEQQ
jgi:imidazolonepropionase-like amidohydrolase